MHRHAYNGRKLSREAGPRKALVRGQIVSLILFEKLETTLAKAKETAPEFERLVTKAKRGTLADLRTIRAEIQPELAFQKLTRELVPTMTERTSGYTRIIKTANRRGDNAPMAVLSLILDAPKPKTDAQSGLVAAGIDTKAAKTKSSTAKKKPAEKAKAGAK